jgi:hypothetical protein
MSQHWNIIVNLYPYFIQISLVFTYSLSVPRSHLRLTFHFIAVSPWLSLVCDYTVFDDPEGAGSTDQSICKGIFPLRVTWRWDCGFWLQEKDHRYEIPFSWHHINDSYDQNDLALWWAPQSSDWAFVCQMSSAEWLFLSLLCSLEGRPSDQPTLER